MGQTNNTIVVFTTDNGAETFTFPDGGITPFKGSKMTTWEGGMRAPMVIRWPGVIRPGTVKNEIFASLDWVPTLVNIAGGPKGDELKKRIEAGQYPGIVKTTLDGVDQTEYLAGSRRSRRAIPSSTIPASTRRRCATRTGRCISRSRPKPRRASSRREFQTQFGAGMVNIKRDPFEMGMGEWKKYQLGMGGALAGPVTAYIYDWNLLPIGQALWLRELETYKLFPPLQDPASYNLDQVMKSSRKHRRTRAGSSDARA